MHKTTAGERAKALMKEAQELARRANVFANSILTRLFKEKPIRF